MNPKEILDQIKSQFDQDDAIYRRLIAADSVILHARNIVANGESEELQAAKIIHLCKAYGFEGPKEILDFKSKWKFTS